MKEIEKNISMNEQLTDALFHDACTIIEQAQETAYRQVNEMLIKRNWLLGLRIQHDVLKEKRAEYGQQVVKNLAQSLLERYGRGFSMRNLYNFVDFYQSHPDIFHAVSGESTIVNAVSAQSEVANILQSLTAKSLSNSSQQPNILQTLTAKSPIRLTWSHYSIILQENSKEARDYSGLNGSDQLYAAKYLTYMPTKEELRREIEQQKEFFRLQQKEKNQN